MSSDSLPLCLLRTAIESITRVDVCVHDSTETYMMTSPTGRYVEYDELIGILDQKCKDRLGQRPSE